MRARTPDTLSGPPLLLSPAQTYADRMQRLEKTFRAGLRKADVGTVALVSRTDAVDALICSLWDQHFADATVDGNGGVALLAVGGYGRRELFPFSDVDLLFLGGNKSIGKSARESIRCMTQAMWDAGIRVSPMTRTPRPGPGNG